MGQKDIDAITGDVLDVAIRLHKQLGPGLLESVYETILAEWLTRAGYRIARQRAIDIRFDGISISGAFRVDILVDERLVIEIKSVEKLQKVHAKQVLTYLRLLHQPVGLLINFGGETLIEGFCRLVNDHRPSAPSAPLRDRKT